jgi:hypothetical protein
MRIRPEDFSNPDSPLPRRSIGIESEYTFQPRRGGPDVYHFTSALLLDRLGIAHHGQYLGSAYGAGRLYPDCALIEYATAEAMGPAAAAVEDMRGVQSLSTIIAGSGYPYKALYRTAGTYLPEVPGEVAKGVTTGQHENFLLPRAVSRDKLIEWVLPTALALRAVWAMAGTLRGDSFVWSQKVWGIGDRPISRLYGRRTAHGKKPMVLIPSGNMDVDTIGDSRFARAEVRVADPSLSVVNEFVSLADISLTLRLLELQQLVGRDALVGMSLVDPVGAAQRYAADLTLKHTELTCDDKTVTALDGQESYLDAFEVINQRAQLPEDEKLAIVVMRNIVDELRRSRPEIAEYTKLALARTGAAPRHYALSRGRTQADVRADNKVVMAENLAWDMVLPMGRGLAYWSKVAERDQLVARVYALAAAAGLTPRARHRAAIIDGDGSGSVVVNWSTYLDGREQKRSFGSAYGD